MWDEMKDLIQHSPAEFLVALCVIVIIVMFSCALSLTGGISLCCP